MFKVGDVGIYTYLLTHKTKSVLLEIVMTPIEINGLVGFSTVQVLSGENFGQTKIVSLTHTNFTVLWTSNV